MKIPILLTTIFGLSALPASAALLFADNFNAPDTGNLDLSDQTGRRSGLNTQIQVRSSGIQHGIVGNQLNFLTSSTGRLRFHSDLDNNTATAEGWHNWASGVTGTQILVDGGLRIEFDWIAGNNASPNWVSVNVGHSNEGAGEPGFRVNHSETDIGMLFRFNGQIQLFDNGAGVAAPGTFTPTIGLRHITMDYTFNSFADGTTVGLVARVDGTQVYSGSPFTWNNNGGALYFEIGTLENTLLDNIRISSIPEPSMAALFAMGGLGFVFRRRR